MSIKTILGSLAAFALVSACASSTPYQPVADGKYGFDQQQIEDDRWTVSFAGNSLTDRQKVETYLLYRAAELTQQQGFDHFRVADSDTNADRRLLASPSTFYDPFYSGFACHYRYYGARGRLYPRSYYTSRHRRSAFHRTRFGYYDPYYDGFGPGAYDYREVTRYDASAEIIMGIGQKPDDPAFFDATQVLKNLAGTIERPDV